MLNRHGLLIGSGGVNHAGIENHLWGFDSRRRKFFEEYYDAALKNSYDGIIGYDCLVLKVYTDLVIEEGINKKEFCFPINCRGLEHAVHPGHEWSGYKGHEKDSAFVSANDLNHIYK